MLKNIKLKGVLHYIGMLLLALTFGIILSQYTLSRVVVDGHSMDYTLKDGSSLWVNRLPFQTYSRGDVIVLKVDGVRMVKRLVGMPGDTLVFKGDKLLINGEPLTEPYVTDSGYEKGLLAKEITLSEDEYLVLGDNRDVSNDSRYYGTVDKKDLLGKVLGDFHVSN